ncbi:hypothetical protein ACFWU5_16305 [Nocardia sp. NPDC058640]|uniref:hypothetical protein n=1 Tax=Nocardia sp. NPDC058640 TaxID=3346571 RepID=UPI0036530378
MPITGLTSARLKLDRAHVHLVDLNERVRVFRKDYPYEFTPQIRQPHPTCDEIHFQIVVKSAHDQPDEWSTIVGDILTNLRAALDHAVFEHIRAKNPKLPQEKIKFPIVDKRAEMETKARWFDRPIYRAVNEVQPYRVQPKPELHPLAILRDLVNADKHRSVVVTNYSSVDMKITTEPVVEVLNVGAHPGVEMAVGAVVASGRFRIPNLGPLPPKLQVRTEIGYTEVIEIPRTTQVRNLTDALADLQDKVRDVLDDLEAAGLS